MTRAFRANCVLCQRSGELLDDARANQVANSHSRVPDLCNHVSHSRASPHSYEGEAEKFSWVLPLPSTPDIALGNDELFRILAAKVHFADIAWRFSDLI